MRWNTLLKISYLTNINPSFLGTLGNLVKGPYIMKAYDRVWHKNLISEPLFFSIQLLCYKLHIFKWSMAVNADGSNSLAFPIKHVFLKDLLCIIPSFFSLSVILFRPITLLTLILMTQHLHSTASFEYNPLSLAYSIYNLISAYFILELDNIPWWVRNNSVKFIASKT